MLKLSDKIHKPQKYISHINEYKIDDIQHMIN